MKPDKIYIPEELPEMFFAELRKPEGECIEYIRKNALIEKIDEILNARPDGGLAIDIAAQAFIDIKKVINSM